LDAASFNLSQIGWKPYFQQQLDLDDLESGFPARVAVVHRSRLVLWAESGEVNFDLSGTAGATNHAVGDWLLLSREHEGLIRTLDRQNLIARKSPGEKASVQLIASNIDTLFIVSSCNQDFNLSRIERYLALSKESGIYPVLVLTKADLCDDPEEYSIPARSLHPELIIEPINALDPLDINRLRPWCGTGQTVAFSGSSGVGKSTLANTLTGANLAVSDIREDDSKGRHTTTVRSLHLLTDGGVVIDTPGMRELQLFDVEDGLEEVFSEIAALASQCRFSDCVHDREPGCAVQAALQSGEIQSRRLENYRKMLREQARNTATLAEQRSSSKSLGKMYRTIQRESRERKGK
jgi:ribosome biogenesis GTPase